MMKLFLLLIPILILSLDCAAQRRADSTKLNKDTMKVVQILGADRYSFKKIDSVTEQLILVGKVTLKQGNTLFYADSAIYDRSAKMMEAFNNVHINDNDSIHAYSNYLLYYTETKWALLREQVRLTDGKSNLYTNELEYDMNQKIGVYRSGGKLINGTSVLTSKEGTYYADFKDIYFKHNVDLKDPKYNLKSDSLLYNTTTEFATFIAKTYIEDSAKRTIETSEGFYDLKSKIASFGARPTIKDGPITIIANQVDTDDNTGMSVLTGSAIFRDTVQGVSVLADSIVSNRNSGSMIATQNPMMIIKQEKDSTFITADTLYSGRLSELPVIEDSVIIDSSVNTSDSAMLGSDSATRDTTMKMSPVKALVARASSQTDSSTSVATDSAASNTADRMPANDVILKDSLSPRPPEKNLAANDTSTKKPPAKLTAKKTSTAAADSSIAKSLSAPLQNNNQPSTGKTSPTPQNDSADRFFRAYRNVKIFSDSMQAVCDSLFYSGKDSIFRLFYDPIVWASKSQVTGDTIFMYTKNKKPHEMYVFEDGLMINETGRNMYNQIRGNRLFGYFANGDIDYIRAKGNAESIYYAKDSEDKLVGINKAQSDIIDMRFRNKELNRVVFISEVTGKMLPYRTATDEDKRLRNFEWHEAKRPKSKFELLRH